MEYFDKMITDKYSLNKSMFNQMSHEERNKKLKEMLKNDKIVVMTDKQFADGLPELKIMHNNLKVLTENVPL